MSFMAAGAVTAGIGVAGSIGGALISGNATKQAQNSANATNLRISQQADAEAMRRYLLSRGVNPGNIPGLPGAAGSSINTTLPVGFTLNGQPAEQALFNILMGKSPDASSSDAKIRSAEEAYLKNFQGDDAEGVRLRRMLTTGWNTGDVFKEQNDYYKANPGELEGAWEPTRVLLDTVKNSGGVDADGNLVGSGGNSSSSSAATSSSGLGDTYDKLLTYAPEVLSNGVYGGGFLKTEQGAFDDIAKQREALAALVSQRNDEMRARSGDILNTELTGLGDVLNRRRAAAGNILDTSLSGLDNVLGTRTTGVNDLYGQEMLGADTYSNSVDQAVARQLNEQAAQRARQGFSGGSSGDALLRARTLASGYQAAGGARAQVGINRSTRLGDVNNQDALSRLQARLANATTLGSADENDALSRLTANKDNAMRLAGILDADARASEVGARLQNSTDRASLVQNDIARQLANLGVPQQLAANQYALKTQAAQAPYAGINALLQNLGFFREGAGNPPAPIIPNVQPVINSGQIAGGALSSLSQGLGDYFTQKSWIDALNRKASVPYTPSPSTPSYNSSGSAPGFI